MNLEDVLCSQAQGLVAAQGVVGLGTGPLTYDRYVRAANYCALGETADPACVPAADNLQCLIGYRCVDRTIRSRN